MSRAPAPKNTKDKKGGQAASTPVVTHEIIPGKVTDHDWLLMQDKDDGEDFIADIRDEILDRTMTHIYYLYLEHQLMPYTISQARDALLQIVEWRFLTYDEGEDDTANDVTWQPDEEPEPSQIDCWATGCVPIKHIKKPMEEIMEEQELNIASISVAPTPFVSLEDMKQISELHTDEVVLERVDPTIDLKACHSIKVKDEKKLKEKERERERARERENERDMPGKRKVTKRHYGPLRSAKVKDMTEPLDVTESKLYTMEYEYYLAKQMMNKTPMLMNITMPMSCHSLVKVQQKRPALERDIKFDEYGNMLSVVKIDPDKLPSHRVKIGHSVLKLKTSEDETQKDKALQYGRIRPKKPPKPKTPQPFDRSVESRITEVITPTGENGKGVAKNITYLPSSLIENIELSPGVTVREGDKVRKGPPRKQRKAHRLNEANLRMVEAPSSRKISVADVLLC